MDYPDKSKDKIVHKILSITNRFSDTDINMIKYAIFLVPIIIFFISSLFIETKTIWIIFGVMLFSISAILYSLTILLDILKKDTGNERMMDVADAIREGSEGFFMTQYSTIFKLSLIFGIAIFVFYFGREITPDEALKSLLSPNIISCFIVVSFFTGALCSAISGYAGMWVSVRANIR
jgi:Na+/H+-translocating membrane pyrophosphatase